MVKFRPFRGPPAALRGFPISAFKSLRTGASIADVLKSRGVHTLVYFHTDHFEPWRTVPGRDGGMDRCIDDVEQYLSSTAELDFARKASLFYKANVNYLTSGERELIRADPDDLLGFVPRSPRDLRIGRAIVQPIVASDHDLQVHIHHAIRTLLPICRPREGGRSTTRVWSWRYGWDWTPCAKTGACNSTGGSSFTAIGL